MLTSVFLLSSTATIELRKYSLLQVAKRIVALGAAKITAPVQVGPT